MFILVSVVSLIIFIMASQYDDESKLLLDHWGFLCGKKDRHVRNPRIEVLVLGSLLKGNNCTLPWKNIQIDDQVLSLNGLSVVRLENNQIREIMLKACPISANSSTS